MRKRDAYKFFLEKLKRSLEGRGVDERIIIMYLKIMGFEEVDCINLTEGGIQWTIVVETKMDLWVSYKAGSVFIT
jgi:hypothetical protein